MGELGGDSRAYPFANLWRNRGAPEVGSKRRYSRRLKTPGELMRYLTLYILLIAGCAAGPTQNQSRNMTPDERQQACQAALREEQTLCQQPPTGFASGYACGSAQNKAQQYCY